MERNEIYDYEKEDTPRKRFGDGKPPLKRVLELVLLGLKLLSEIASL